MESSSEFRYRGAIKRIRLRNFMTYNDTEIRPGPNLNMILGPNGTGKSAVVCSIIIGLAGEVTLTGRGSSPADFVKKDTTSGSTEIELYNAPGRPNYIVERKIIVTGQSGMKVDHKSEWKINRKTALKSDVQKLTSKLNIKVDNLCQFLPQDSVTQFVKMNPSELLLNTLKAAGDNQLVEDHKSLVNYTKECDERHQGLENLERACEQNEVNARRLETEVHHLRQREQLVKERSVCIQKYHYVRYIEAKKETEQIRSERNKLKEDLENIESSSEPYRHAVDLYKGEEAKRRRNLESSNNDIKSVEGLIGATKRDIENRKVDCQEEYAKFRAREEQEKSRESKISIKQQELESLECKLNSIRDVDYSKQIEKITVELEKVKEERKTCSRKKSEMDDKLRAQVIDMDELKRECDQIERVKERKTNLLKMKFADSYKVLEWYSVNRRRFKQDIFSPMMCEINVKDPRYNRIIENAINRQELGSFVCQSAEDLSLFTRLVRDELKIRFNVILAPDKPLTEFLNEVSHAQDLSNLGVKAYLKDLIDAPEPIMRYLCGNNNFHRIPVADSCSEAQLKELLAKCPKFYVGNQFYSVSKSRYDGQLMTVTDSVREAQFLNISLDSKRLNRCRDQYSRIQAQHTATRQEIGELNNQDDMVKRKWQDLADKQREFRNKQDEKKRLETLIQITFEAVEKLKGERIDIEKERQKLKQSVEKINFNILTHGDKLDDHWKKWIHLKKEHMLNLICVKVAERNHKRAIEKYQRAKRDTSRLKEEILKKQRTLEASKTSLVSLMKAAEEKIPKFKDGKLDRSTEAKFNAISEKTSQQLEQLKDDLAIRIQRIRKDTDHSILDEFNRQNEEARDKRFRIAELQSTIQQIESQRDAIKTNWLSRLAEVIEVIDTNYQEFMRKLSYDGKVKLDFIAEQPNNFSAYGIKIMVKYRDDEELIPLSSTRQSGGERSVATMIYMLALQTKTTVPFRCVDEINQGMDKENERKVFELLVKTADSSSSQYFLVSPKLLTNLPYSEKMKIHVVFNGKDLNVAWNKL